MLDLSPCPVAVQFLLWVLQHCLQVVDYSHSRRSCPRLSNKTAFPYTESDEELWASRAIFFWHYFVVYIIFCFPSTSGLALTVDAAINAPWTNTRPGMRRLRSSRLHHWKYKTLKRMRMSVLEHGRESIAMRLETVVDQWWILWLGGWDLACSASLRGQKAVAGHVIDRTQVLSLTLLSLTLHPAWCLMLLCFLAWPVPDFFQLCKDWSCSPKGMLAQGLGRGTVWNMWAALIRMFNRGPRPVGNVSPCTCNPLHIEIPELLSPLV